MKTYNTETKMHISCVWYGGSRMLVQMGNGLKIISYADDLTKPPFSVEAIQLLDYKKLYKAEFIGLGFLCGQKLAVSVTIAL